MCVLVEFPTVDVSPSHPEIVTEAAVIDVSYASLASKPGSPDRVSPFVRVRFPPVNVNTGAVLSIVVTLLWTVSATSPVALIAL